MAFAKKLDFLPLIFDATNPTPSQGWQQKERLGFAERSKVDAVLALAFQHHLSISKNIPVDQIIDWITNIAPRGIIEFVPKDDITVKKMLLVREDIFPNYNKESFEKILSSKCSIDEKHQKQTLTPLVMRLSNRSRCDHHL